MILNKKLEIIKKITNNYGLLLVHYLCALLKFS